MSLTSDDVAKVAILARLRLSPDELAMPLEPPPDGWLRKPIRPQGLLAELEPYLTAAT